MRRKGEEPQTKEAESNRKETTTLITLEVEAGHTAEIRRGQDGELEIKMVNDTYIKHPSSGWQRCSDFTDEELETLRREHGVGPCLEEQVPKESLKDLKKK